MSIYRIALATFLIVTGLLFFLDLGRWAEIVAGVAALVAGGLLLLGGANSKAEVRT